MEFNSDNDFEDDHENFNTTDDTSSNEGESRNLTRERTERKRREFTNIILDDEMKELIIQVSRTAQDPDHQDFLSKQTSYEIYHIPLKNYMVSKYGKKPTQTDNLAFVLALSYPEYMIHTFNSFADFKLAFNNIEEDSDFKPCGYDVRDYGLETCICNESLMYIHKFQNIHSGINFNIGSVCNKHYGLISKNDINYKTNETKLKEHKEKERERKEGLPEGFYENERQIKKQERQEKKLLKEQDKQMKIEINLMKKEEKITRKNLELLNKELQKLNKNNPNSHSSKKCYNCKKDVIFNNIDKMLLCSICCPQEQKEKIQRVVTKIKYNSKDCSKCKHKFINEKECFNKLCNKCYDLKECLNCELDFKGITDLCINCQQKWCLEKCKMCPEKFLKYKIVNDLYCLDCDEKLRQCIDCDRDILKPSERCYKCHHNFINKIMVKNCEYCDDEFEVKKDGTWKTCCSDCYFDNRKLEKCQDCNEYFKKMKNENWRTRCGPCYHKNKNTVSKY